VELNAACNKPLWNAVKPNLRWTQRKLSLTSKLALNPNSAFSSLDYILRMLIKLWNLRLQFRWAIRERTEIERERKERERNFTQEQFQGSPAQTSQTASWTKAQQSHQTQSKSERTANQSLQKDKQGLCWYWPIWPCTYSNILTPALRHTGCVYKNTCRDGHTQC